MKYLATTISKPDIIHILEASIIVPNSLCVVCLYSGESIVINDDPANDEILRATGKFYEKEISDTGWLLIQINGEYSLIGNAFLCPVKLI